MGRFLLAVRAFFQVLRSAAVARQVAVILRGEATVPSGQATAGAERRPPPPPPASPGPVRSDAITLLASLQREARFVDFVKESLADYSDAQVGAVVRDVHRGCAEVLDRLFDLQPLLAQAEDTPVDVPADFDEGRYQLVGNVSGTPPFHGRLVHHGWQATRCQLAVWSGSAAAARVVAPAEVELA